jgi:hypothetical protein
LKATRIAAVLAFLCLFGLILFFTFRHTSRVSDLAWMPERWGLWFDAHDEFRHFLGFAVFAGMGFAINLDPFFSKSRHRFIRRFRSSRNRTGRLGAFLVLIYLLELGQIGMPERDFDWMDIVNGWAGVLLAWTFWFMFKSNSRRRRHLTHDKRHVPINVSTVRFR